MDGENLFIIHFSLYITSVIANQEAGTNECR